MNGNNKNLLSICCLGYNHSEFLEENINSIADINYNNIEVIIVDDGSKDNSVEILNRLVGNYSFNITIIAQENTGNIGRNFNNAYKKANGEFITFISLDDVYNPRVIEEQINVIKDDKNIAFVTSSMVININNEGYISDTRNLLVHNVDNPLDILELEYTELDSFYIQGTLFRKDIIDAVDAFDEDMTGDDIVLRTKVLKYMLKKPHYKCKIIEDNACFYRLHNNNIHKNTYRQIKTATEYLDKYWSEREDPESLIYWIESYISNHEYDEYITLFSLNNRASRLLLNKKIQKKIKRKIIREFIYSLLSPIYKKRRVGENNREITILNIIKIRYKKSNKIIIGKHYSNKK
ncbi:glycosyltransferase family 2 protein [Pectobacterium punjabense]|uniref:glycosyltransferase family 2 protein n=1 Tax=Pectobacterium punjabense TaxID=2108399 RepID=UPI001BFFB291|nr:glycosyltransferase family 2 protein [Pectobacterium punjabense]MBT9182785.1 glycosyltransferase family 2 protein [Pectobacterium punjabense]